MSQEIVNQEIGHDLIRARFKEAIACAGITQQELADKAGISVRTISRISAKGLISADTAEAIAPILNTSESFLRGKTDDPSPLRKDGERLLIIAAPEGVPRIMGEKSLTWVPVISPTVKVSAGPGNACEDIEWEEVDHFALFDGRIAAMYSEGEVFSLYAEGDSMEPQIHDGDLVVFVRISEWVSGNIVVAYLDGRLLVKGVVKGPKGETRLKSANKNYEDIVIGPASLFRVIGSVIKVTRQWDPKPVV